MSYVGKIMSDVVQIISDLFSAFAIRCFPKGYKSVRICGKSLADRGLGDFVRNGASAPPETCAFFGVGGKKVALRLCRSADNALICRGTQYSANGKRTHIGKDAVAAGQSRRAVPRAGVPHGGIFSAVSDSRRFFRICRPPSPAYFLIYTFTFSAACLLSGRP
mgnify:CR=1 FL=1